MRYILLDRVTSLEIGDSLEAIKVFPLTHEAFRDSVNFRVLVPPALLIESMAQAGGVLLSSSFGEKPSGLVFAKIEKVAFHVPVLPGSRLIVTAKVVEPSENASKLESTIVCDGEPVAEMTYFLAKRDIDSSEQKIDYEAFLRAHTERAAVLGICSLMGGSGVK
jgi:3-hydroxyacyl-[acyl-carrier-protein] dehydratase